MLNQRRRPKRGYTVEEARELGGLAQCGRTVLSVLIAMPIVAPTAVEVTSVMFDCSGVFWLSAPGESDTGLETLRGQDALYGPTELPAWKIGRSHGRDRRSALTCPFTATAP